MKGKNIFAVLFMSTVILAMSCSNNNNEKKTTVEARKDTSKQKNEVVESVKGPVINIGDTLSIKRMVLTMKDSASDMQRVSMKLAEIYGTKLGAVIKKYNLKTTGAPVAWYKGANAPYFFEAGI
ncbi:MAG: hypothetical protein ABIN94_15760, partial [Ferruginibacter sp.]